MYPLRRVLQSSITKIAAVALLCTAQAFAGGFYLPGNLVVSVEGNGASTGSYGDNQAAPLTLYQFHPTGTTSASFVNLLELPQTGVGANSAVSGEYGSSSEGTLQLSGNGDLLTIMGYGINANTFNANPGVYGPDPSNKALAQSGSLTGQGYIPVSRVVALIDFQGNVNSTTALYGVFDQNNPRSAFTKNGHQIYISGQGNAPDATSGVFLANLGSNTPTVSLTLGDAGTGLSQDTRVVTIYNGQLYVSTDSKKGPTNRSYLGTLGTGLPTTTVGAPVMLPGFGNTGGTGKYQITTGADGNGNGLNTGKQINLSPEQYFFANSTTLYVTDSGDGKQTSANSSVGDGGLQKWSFVAGNWVLDYTLHNGLTLVLNTNTSGTTGLLGLTGKVIGGEVELFATNYTAGDLDQTYLYGITDELSATLASQVSGESFSILATAPADANFKGVSFAPTPEPGTLALMGTGMAGLLAAWRRKFRA
jgi:hypothetical protein